MNLEAKLAELHGKLEVYKARLVAVSKTKPLEQLQEVYNTGQRIFGENRVQELLEKHPALPDDIQWHMIGHLQRNKVKQIAPFISMIHAVDSPRLAAEVSKQAIAHNRTIPVLMQVHIAEESSKFGFEPKELLAWFEAENHKLEGLEVAGLMGMATFTDDTEQVRREFKSLASLKTQIEERFQPGDSFSELSMGMSGDYEIALEEGATLIRIGSMIFGSR